MEKTPLLLRSEKTSEGREERKEFKCEFPPGARLRNLKKRYYSLSSLNLQNIAKEWIKEELQREEQKGAVDPSIPLDLQDLKDSQIHSKRNLVMRSLSHHSWRLETPQTYSLLLFAIHVPIWFASARE